MSLTGPIMIAAAAPLKENSAIQNHNLGTKAITPDGRIFRYAQAGAVALAAGQLQVAPDVLTNHENLTVTAAVAAGGQTVNITVGATAITANDYDGGYLVVNDEAGQGYCYVIDACPASAGTENIDVTLLHAVEVALTTSSQVTLVKNPYKLVVVSSGGTQTDIPVGVASRVVDLNNYCWLQTGGVASIQTDTSDATAGTEISIGANDDGAVETHNNVNETVVGICPAGSNPIAGEFNPFVLTIDKG